MDTGMSCISYEKAALHNDSVTRKRKTVQTLRTVPFSGLWVEPKLQGEALLGCFENGTYIVVHMGTNGLLAGIICRFGEYSRRRLCYRCFCEFLCRQLDEILQLCNIVLF